MIGLSLLTNCSVLDYDFPTQQSYFANRLKTTLIEPKLIHCLWNKPISWTDAPNDNRSGSMTKKFDFWNTINAKINSVVQYQVKKCNFHFSVACEILVKNFASGRFCHDLSKKFTKCLTGNKIGGFCPDCGLWDGGGGPRRRRSWSHEFKVTLPSSNLDPNEHLKFKITKLPYIKLKTRFFFLNKIQDN